MILFTNLGVSRHTAFHLVGSQKVKHIRRRQYDPLFIERIIGLVLGPYTALYRPFLKHCTLTSKAGGLYDGPCPNLLRGNKVLIFVPSDCKSAILQSSDLSSLPDRWSILSYLEQYFYLICNLTYSGESFVFLHEVFL